MFLIAPFPDHCLFVPFYDVDYTAASLKGQSTIIIVKQRYTYPKIDLCYISLAPTISFLHGNPFRRTSNVHGNNALTTVFVYIKISNFRTVTPCHNIRKAQYFRQDK